MLICKAGFCKEDADSDVHLVSGPRREFCLCQCHCERFPCCSHCVPKAFPSLPVMQEPPQHLLTDPAHQGSLSDAPASPRQTAAPDRGGHLCGGNPPAPGPAMAAAVLSLHSCKMGKDVLPCGLQLQCGKAQTRFYTVALLQAGRDKAGCVGKQSPTGG